MDEFTAPSPLVVSVPLATRPARAPSLRAWITEGLRCAFLLRPRIAGQPTPLQLLIVLLAIVAGETALARLEVPGPATFDLFGFLAPWWSTAASLLLVWSLLWGVPADARGGRPGGLASWFMLWYVASVPLLLLVQLQVIASAHGALPPALARSPWFAWGSFGLFWLWLLAVPFALGRSFGMDRRRLLALVGGLVAIYWISSTHFTQRPWYPDEPHEEREQRLSLSQEIFEAQQAVWQQSIAALAPQRQGVRDVYALVFAPYAREDVFLRESTMVAEVLAQRFDAQGRVLQLVNHASTADRLPWATPLNLQRAVQALSQRMDREQDVLVVYLTSHGARNFELSASHWPLRVQGIGPAELRRALDEAGVRHRVIAVSACYSGGWIAPLASDTTLVMTAADPDHTSYGCGRLSQLTFFGRAVFDEQLRSTRSFEEAFAAAVPVIRQREQEAGKPDGFSNPQISVGERIRPVLDELAQRLDDASRH